MFHIAKDFDFRINVRDVVDREAFDGAGLFWLEFPKDVEGVAGGVKFLTIDESTLAVFWAGHQRGSPCGAEKH